MADYLTELKRALQEAAVREYPADTGRMSVFVTLRAQIRRATRPDPRAALRRLSVVLPAGLSVAIFVLAVAVLRQGRTEHDRGHAATEQPPYTGLRRGDAIDPVQRARRGIDSALARGAHPMAPGQSVSLPILGSAGTRKLEDFRGNVVVLNVFASWCDPCRAESAALERTQMRLAGQGATVLGVTYLSGESDSQAFLRSAHITYPVVRDPTGRFVRSFGVTGLPETFVIDRYGRIVAARRYEVGDRWLAQALARA